MAFNKYKSTKETKSTEPTYEIEEKFGALTNEEGKWNKELNLISWNNAEPKFDLRPWKETDEEGRKMMKGITLTATEIEALYEILKNISESEE